MKKLILLLLISINAFGQSDLHFPNWTRDNLEISYINALTKEFRQININTEPISISRQERIDNYFSQLKELDRLDSIAYYQQLIQVKGTIEYEDVHISKTHIWNELLKKEVSDTIRDTHKEMAIAYYTPIGKTKKLLYIKVGNNLFDLSIPYKFIPGK